MPSADPRQLPIDEATADAVFAGLKLEGFFPEFGAELCAKLFPRSGVQHFRPGEALIEQGERGRDLFLLLAGEVDVRRAGADAARLSYGALVGEIALLTGATRTATVAAATPVFAFRLRYEDVGYVLTHNPALAQHLQALQKKRSA